MSKKYEDCPENIRKLIEHHHENGLMLEYRRRGFEIDALTREIVLRVRRTGRVPWGGTLPLDRAMMSARTIAKPRLYVLHDTTSDVVNRMARELETSVRGLLSESQVVTEIERATDIVVLLTRHVLDDDSRSFKELFKQSRP